MRVKLKKTVLSICVLALASACEKKYDLPPVKSIEQSNKINIAQVKAKLTHEAYRFKGDSNLYVVVTADEVSGNFYKDIYVQDLTGALHVKLLNSGGLFIGDSIRINLYECLLNNYNNLIQLDSVDSEKSIVKLAAGILPKAKSLSLLQVATGGGSIHPYQSALVNITGVEFTESDRDKPYGDATGKSSVNRTLKSCDGSTLTVRTGGYAVFASQLTGKGNGTVTGILGQYGSSMQLYLRRAGDAVLSNSLCGSIPNGSNSNYLEKNFNDNSLTSSGWSVQTVSNTVVKWACSSFSGTPSYGSYAKISGYVNGTNNVSEIWLISPPIDLRNSVEALLTFETAAGKFAGSPLEILVSENYTGALPSTAQWTNISNLCAVSTTTSSYVWTKSGDVSLKAYHSGQVSIGFKYKSSATAACTYELDNIAVREK